MTDEIAQTVNDTVRYVYSYHRQTVAYTYKVIGGMVVCAYSPYTGVPGGPGGYPLKLEALTKNWDGRIRPLSSLAALLLGIQLPPLPLS